MIVSSGLASANSRAAVAWRPDGRERKRFHRPHNQPRIAQPRPDAPSCLGARLIIRGRRDIDPSGDPDGDPSGDSRGIRGVLMRRFGHNWRLSNLPHSQVPTSGISFRGDAVPWNTALAYGATIITKQLPRRARGRGVLGTGAQGDWGSRWGGRR